jgi:hypothetical protein
MNGEEPGPIPLLLAWKYLGYFDRGGRSISEHIGELLADRIGRIVNEARLYLNDDLPGHTSQTSSNLIDGSQYTADRLGELAVYYARLRQRGANVQSPSAIFFIPFHLSWHTVSCIYHTLADSMRAEVRGFS